MIKIELTEPQVRALYSCGVAALELFKTMPRPQRRGLKVALRPAVAELSRRLAEHRYREKRGRRG